MPASSQLSPSQQQVADRLIVETGMTRDEAIRVATIYRGSGPAGPPQEDDPLIEYAAMFTGWGAPTDQVAVWMLAHGLSVYKRLHIQAGYTPEQYMSVVHVIAMYDDPDYIEQHDNPDASGDDEDDPGWAWRALLRTVPPDFLTLCVQAGVTSPTEAADLNARRIAADPDVVGQLTTLAGLLGNH